MIHNSIQRQSLGKPRFLGSLYNARTDEFVSGAAFKSLHVNDIKPSPKNNLKYTFENEYKEKFKELDIDAQLKLSLMLGMLNLKGNGLYFHNDKKLSKTFRIRFNYFLQTFVQDVNFNKCQDDLSTFPFETQEATHFIERVYWGANVNVILESDELTPSEKQKIEASVKADFNKGPLNLHLDGYFKSNSETSRIFKKFKVTIYSDVPFDGDGVPMTVDDTMAYLLKVPDLLPNDKKGVPIKYDLCPLSFFDTNTLKAAIFEDTIAKNYEINIESIYNKYKVLEMRFNDLKSMLSEVHEVIQPSAFDKLEDALTKMKKSEAEFQRKTREALVALRGGDKKGEEMIQEALKMENDTFGPNKMREYCQEIDKLYCNKCDQFRNYKNKQVTIIHPNLDLSNVLSMIDTSKAFILFLNDYSSGDDHKSLFSNLLDTQDRKVTSFIAVDLNTYPLTTYKIKSSSIHYYYKRRLVYDNFLQFYDENKNFVKPKNDIKYPVIQNKPTVASKLKVICPHKKCSNSYLNWVCLLCLNPIFIDRETMKLYCSCYSYLIWDAEFRCGDKKHIPYENFYTFQETRGDDCKNTVESILQSTMQDETEQAYIWPNGDKFVSKNLSASLASGKLEGPGEYYWTDGYRCKGVWNDNKKNGEFELYGPYKEICIGSWKAGAWSYQAKLIIPNSSKRVEITKPGDEKEVKDHPMYLKWLNMNFERVLPSQNLLATYQEKVNHLGSKSKLGINGKYYCGRKRGECFCCGGENNKICGPSNGCNCKYCMKLDIETRKLPKGFWVNKAGVVSCQIALGKVRCGRSFPDQQNSKAWTCEPKRAQGCPECEILSQQLETIYVGVNHL